MLCCKLHNLIVETGEKKDMDHKYIVTIHRTNSSRESPTLNLQGNLQTKEEEVGFVERREGMTNFVHQFLNILIDST